MIEEDFDFDFQLKIFEKFVHWYLEKKVNKIFDNNERSKYSSYWHDLISSQCNIKLVRLFKNTLNVNENKIKQFYKYVSYDQVPNCAILPDSVTGWIFHRFHEMTKEFNDPTSNIDNHNNNKINDIYKFVVLCNGIHVMVKGYLLVGNGRILLGKIPSIINRTENEKQRQTETEAKENVSNNNNTSNNSNNNTDSDSKTMLCLLICEHICDSMAQTNLFGNYKIFNKDDEYDETTDKEQELILSSNKKAYNLCKQLLFDNSFDELNKLIKHCIKNINNIHSGVLEYLSNNLSYVIFHDLAMNELNNSNNTNNSKLLFPKLLKMFKFMYNFSCYIYCYPQQEDYEHFYICQYFDLRDTLFEDIFGNNKDNKLISEKASKLNCYNYFVDGYGAGTLLHKACHHGHTQFCKILSNDGFNVTLPNRLCGRNKKTPYDAAADEKHENILLLLRPFIKQEAKRQENEESEENNDISASNMKSLEEGADLLLKQIMVGKYFLICLGIDVDDEYKIKKEKYNVKDFFEREMRDFVTSELYVKLNGLKSGLSVVDNVNVNVNVNVMNCILNVIIRLLDTKMIISDDLIILTWLYCNSINNDSDNKNKDKFLTNLLNCVTECLSAKTKYKTRNYLYFKQFLLHSNIWYCKDNENNKLLFNYVYDLADKLLIEQKKYIQSSIEKEEKQDTKNWNALCNFNKYNNSNVQFRQDKISNGIKSLKNIKDAYLAAIRISNPEYNVLSEFNDKIYLTQCLTFANENNEYFQKEITKLFEKTNGTVKKAPVKTFDRCLVKSSLVFLFCILCFVVFCICILLFDFCLIDTDYSNEDFPNGACILDYLRCSITFKTPKELLDAVEFVIDEIENKKIESITQILRIKNGFNNILNWDGKNIEEYNYVDLKMNVIFNDKNNKESQIVEIQFLLDFLLEAKKLGHKYYGIKRKEIQVHSISNIVYNTYSENNKYKTKILSLIKNKDLNQFASHLFLRPNCILSMFTCPYKTWVPLLYDVGATQSLKVFSLFLDCLFHFGEILLNEKIPVNYNKGCYSNYNIYEYNADVTNNILKNHKLFIQKYLNFNFGQYPSIQTASFVKCNIFI